MGLSSPLQARSLHTLVSENGGEKQPEAKASLIISPVSSLDRVTSRTSRSFRAASGLRLRASQLRWGTWGPFPSHQACGAAAADPCQIELTVAIKGTGSWIPPRWTLMWLASVEVGSIASVAKAVSYIRQARERWLIPLVNERRAPQPHLADRSAMWMVGW